jgi:hypothetical protein
MGHALDLLSVAGPSLASTSTIVACYRRETLNLEHPTPYHRLVRNMGERERERQGEDEKAVPK